MPLLYDASVLIGRFMDEDNVRGIELPKGSPSVDLLLELFKASDDRIETGWLAFKHAIGDHLFVIGSKRFEERCSRKQA